MFLSKRSNGKYYIFYKSPSGKMTCKSTGTKNKAEASKYYLEFSIQSRDKVELKLNPISFNQLVFEFLKYSESIHSQNHTLSLKSTFKAMINYLGDLQVELLTKDKVLRYLQYRSRLVTPYTLKRDIESLSSLFNWAIDRNYIYTNICKGIKRPKLPEKLPVFFTNWEFDRLIAHTLDNDLKDVFVFAVNTGLRQMELLTLEWNQVDLENRLLILNNRTTLTKSKRIRSIPLNYKAYEVIVKRNQKSEKNSFIFTYHSEQIKQQFISHKIKKIVRVSNINPKLNFHSLRHTFASWLVQKGVSIYEVSKLLGHSDIKTTQIYAHLRGDDLKRAVDLL